MRVIDSSSLAKYVNREKNWKKVEQILEEGCTSIDLSLKEVGNSLWKRVIGGEISEKQARGTLKEFIALRPFKISSQEVLYDGALGIALDNRLSFYDSLFVELAKQMKVTLVTSDPRQVEISRKSGVETIHIV